MNRQTENRNPQQCADNSAKESAPKFERRPTDQEPTVVPQEQLCSGQQTSATFAILIRHKGEERAMELPLTDRMIAQLAIEAEFRDTTITKLIADLVAEIATNDKFNLVFQPHAKHAIDRGNSPDQRVGSGADRPMLDDQDASLYAAGSAAERHGNAP